MSDNEEAGETSPPQETTPTPEEEVTQEHDLRAIATKAAVARRRGLHGDPLHARG